MLQFLLFLTLSICHPIEIDQSAMTAQAQAQSNVNAMNAVIPSLQANVNQTKWIAYEARQDHADYYVMRGITGRLEARGYDWDYNAVFEYFNDQVETKAVKRAQTQAQYARAQANLGNTQSAVTRLSVGLLS